MKNKKGEFSQVFVYIFSIIMIVFVGFMVVKFVSSFLGSAETRSESVFKSDFDKDFLIVYRTYGSEKAYSYKMSSQVKLICFIQNRESIEKLDLSAVYGTNTSELEMLYDNGDRIVLLGTDTIVNQYRPEKEFYIDEGSFCMIPKNGKISLFLQNIKNKVYISENILNT